MRNVEDAVLTAGAPSSAGVTEEPNSFRNSVMKLQKKVAMISVVLMAIGGIVIGLGVLLRPVLRLVWPHKLWIVTLATDFLFWSGVLQILVAGLCCFTTTWEMDVPLIAGVVLTGFLILFEISAVAFAFFLPTKSDVFPSEKLFHAWYTWECAESGSCREAYLSYIYRYMFPQTALTMIAIALQCSTVFYLCRFLVTLRTRRLRMWKGIEDLRPNMDETRL